MTQTTKDKWNNVIQILGAIGMIASIIGAFALVGIVDGDYERESFERERGYKWGVSHEWFEYPDYVRNSPHP